MFQRLLLFFLSLWLLLIPVSAQAEIPCGAIPRTQLILEAFQPEVGIRGILHYGATAHPDALGHSVSNGYGGTNTWLLVARARLPFNYGFELGFTAGVGTFQWRFEKPVYTGVYHLSVGAYWWILEGPVAIGARADATPSFLPRGRFSYGQTLEVRADLKVVRFSLGWGINTLRGEYDEPIGYAAMGPNTEITVPLDAWRIERRR